MIKGNKIMTLNGKIQKIIDNNYGNFFGVADVKEYENELVSYGGEIVKGYNFWYKHRDGIT